VSAASFLVIRLLGQEQNRRRTSAESRLIKARHHPHDSGGLSRTPLMYRQQEEPHEPVACAARFACLVTCHIVHITRDHSESHEHE
jgi:hypothetical protein